MAAEVKIIAAALKEIIPSLLEREGQQLTDDSLSAAGQPNWNQDSFSDQIAPQAQVVARLSAANQAITDLEAASTLLTEAGIHTIQDLPNSPSQATETVPHLEFNVSHQAIYTRRKVGYDGFNRIVDALMERNLLIEGIHIKIQPRETGDLLRTYNRLGVEVFNRLLGSPEEIEAGHPTGIDDLRRHLGIGMIALQSLIKDHLTEYVDYINVGDPTKSHLFYRFGKESVDTLRREKEAVDINMQQVS